MSTKGKDGKDGKDANVSLLPAPPRHIDRLRFDASRVLDATDWDWVIARQERMHQERMHHLKLAQGGNLLSAQKAYQMMVDDPWLLWGPDAVEEDK